MKAYLTMAITMAAAQAKDVLLNAGTPLLGLEAGETPTSLIVNQLRLWVVIIFIYLAVSMAWKISTDNEPDT